MYRAIIINILLINIINCKLIDFEEIKEENSLDVCIQTMLKLIQGSEPLIDVTAVNFNKHNQLAILHEMKTLRIVSRSFYMINNTAFNKLYIVNTGNYKEFENGLKLLIKDYYWNPRGKFIVVIENMSNFKEQVSKQLYDNNIFNVTVLNKVANGYEIYKFNPHLDACGRPEIKTLESLITFSELTHLSQIYSVPTPKSLQGCQIKMVSHNYWPFVNFNKTQREIKGLFQILHQLLEETEGINIQLKQYIKKEDFGRVLDNYTYTGMLSWIQDRKVEGAVGGYSLTFGRVKALDYTYPFQLDYSKAVIRRAALLSNWRAVYLQFTLDASVIIGVFIIFFCIFAAHFAVFEKIKKDSGRNVLIVFGYLCSNMRTKYIKPEHSLRIVLCNLLLFVFFMSYTIQAYLLSATSTPIRGHQVTNLKEVLSTFTAVKSWSWQTVFSLKAPLDCGSVIECLSIIRDDPNKKLYTVVSEIPFITTSWMFNDEYGESELYVMDEPVIIMYPTVFFRRGSTILKSYNKLLDKCHSSGLVRKYFGDILFLDHLKYGHESHERSPENINELVEVFIILNVGYLVSVVAFMYECRVQIKARLKIFIDSIRNEF